MLAIEELHEKLKAEGIQHEYRCYIDKSQTTVDEFHYLYYPSKEYYIGDFIQHFGIEPFGKFIHGYSYGAEKNLMEVMGFDIIPEKDGDDVKGYIGVEEAYRMIKRAMQEG